MNIAITGASGFVGTNLQNYLKPSYLVQPISVRYIPNQQFDIEADAIIHLSGKAHDLKKVSRPSAYYEANFELSKQFFDAFLSSEAKVFIFMSSVKAVADSVDGILSEVEVPNPQTAYGKSKLAAEAYILSQNLSKGKKVYILRPCMIHGPGNKGNLNLLYQLVKKGIPYPLGAFQNKRSFVSMGNLNFIIEKLILLQPESGIYNIADDASVSTVEVVNLMAESLQKKSRILYMPPKFIIILAKIGTFLKLPFNEEKLQKLTENYVVSNQKIKTALQINKLPVSATEGLRKTLKSFQTPNL